MKTITRHARTAGSATLLLLLAQPALQAGEIRDRITPEQMRQRQAAGAHLPKGSSLAAKPDPRARSSAEQSIIAQSTILSDGTYWTLVPDGSVLHVPEKHQARVVDTPAGTCLNWIQFAGRNRSWLGTHNVDLETAAGRKPLDKAAVDSWARRGTVMVAVHRGGAISVKRPQQESPEADKPSSDKTNTAKS